MCRNAALDLNLSQMWKGQFYISISSYWSCGVLLLSLWTRVMSHIAVKSETTTWVCCTLLVFGVWTTRSCIMWCVRSRDFRPQNFQKRASMWEHVVFSCVSCDSARKATLKMYMRLDDAALSICVTLVLQNGIRKTDLQPWDMNITKNEILQCIRLFLFFSHQHSSMFNYASYSYLPIVLNGVCSLSCPLTSCHCWDLLSDLSACMSPAQLYISLIPALIKLFLFIAHLVCIFMPQKHVQHRHTHPSYPLLWDEDILASYITRRGNRWYQTTWSSFNSQRGGRWEGRLRWGK